MPFSLVLVVVCALAGGAAHATQIATPVAAGSVPSSAEITPLNVDAASWSTSATPNAVTVGPQAILVLFSGTYKAQQSLLVVISIVNARFAQPGAISLFGKDSAGALVALSTTGCTTEHTISTVAFHNCAAANGAPSAALITGISYDGATQLQYAGQSIQMTATLESEANGIFTVLEYSKPINVVTSTGTGTTPAPGISVGPSNTITTTHVLLTATAGAGSGTITRSIAGASYPSDISVSLTAAPAQDSAFAGWSGACTGTSPVCQLAMSEDRAVTATFTPLIRIGAVLSSAQADPQSFLRFTNTGSAAGTVTVSLSDSGSGRTLTTWTSPRIAPGTAQQFAVATLEAAAGTFVKPRYYSVQVTPQFPGAFQHVVWSAGQGLLTDQSTCNAGAGTPGTQLAFVHSSAIGDAGYPATVVVHNTGASAAATVLSVTSAATGALLGSYTTAQIAANGQALIPVAQIETDLNLPRATVMATQHYVITATGGFSGYLQNLVANDRVGVTTDLTAMCAMAAVP